MHYSETRSVFWGDFSRLKQPKKREITIDLHDGFERKKRKKVFDLIVYFLSFLHMKKIFFRGFFVRLIMKKYLGQICI